MANYLDLIKKHGAPEVASKITKKTEEIEKLLGNKTPLDAQMAPKEESKAQKEESKQEEELTLIKSEFELCNNEYVIFTKSLNSIFKHCKCQCDVYIIAPTDKNHTETQCINCCNIEFYNIPFKNLYCIYLDGATLFTKNMLERYYKLTNNTNKNFNYMFSEDPDIYTNYTKGITYDFFSENIKKKLNDYMSLEYYTTLRDTNYLTKKNNPYYKKQIIEYVNEKKLNIYK